MISIQDQHGIIRNLHLTFYPRPEGDSELHLTVYTLDKPNSVATSQSFTYRWTRNGRDNPYRGLAFLLLSMLGARGVEITGWFGDSIDREPPIPDNPLSEPPSVPNLPKCALVDNDRPVWTRESVERDWERRKIRMKNEASEREQEENDKCEYDPNQT